MRVALVILGASLVLVGGCGPAREKTGQVPARDDPGVIVFNLSAGDRLRSIRPDGTGLQPFKLRESCDPQAFSRDGQLVACDSTPWGVYLMRRDGSDWHRIPLPPGNSHSPSLSPDSDELVYLYSRDEYGNTFELWKAGIDGEDPQRLVAGDNAEPTWSPDGARIAFVHDLPAAISGSDCHFAGDLVVSSTAGGDKRVIAKGSATPEWSPDGKRLAFMSDCATISTVAVDGGSPTVLVREAWHPVWSPDGKLIAFLRETGPCGHATCLQRIFVVEATGGKPRPVSPTVFDPFVFAWLPSAAVGPSPDSRTGSKRKTAPYDKR